MGLQDRAKATAKNVEGKVQETVGNMTGDSGAKVEGKKKQVEANIGHAAEDVKDTAKDIVD